MSQKVHQHVSKLDPKYTLMLMQWGQFVDHDLTHTPMLRGFHNTILECGDCESKVSLFFIIQDFYKYFFKSDFKFFTAKTFQNSISVYVYDKESYFFVVKRFLTNQSIPVVLNIYRMCIQPVFLSQYPRTTTISRTIPEIPSVFLSQDLCLDNRL